VLDGHLGSEIQAGLVLTLSADRGDPAAPGLENLHGQAAQPTVGAVDQHAGAARVASADPGRTQREHIVVNE
jgi:hypothetical protein